MKRRPEFQNLIDNMHQRIIDYAESKNQEHSSREELYELQFPDLDKYYLFFRSDNGSREDCNTYYSNIVIAKNRKEAIDKYIKYANINEEEFKLMYTFERHDVIS